MGYFDRIAQNAPNLDVRHGPGLGSHLLETGEHLGFSYLAGRVNTQYGERAEFRGYDMTDIAGLGAKTVAVLADVFGFGSGWSHHMNTAANALLGAHMVAKGAEDGLAAAKKAGQLSSGKSTPAMEKVKGTALGAIPPAPQPGKYLDLDRCAAIASMNG